jgi:hypothetical protein
LLLGRERDYPNDAPSWRELRDWFAASVVLVFGGAAVGSGLLLVSARSLCGRQLPGTPVVLSLVFLLGLIGGSAAGGWLERCLFTWPASLYAALHATVWACLWAEAPPPRRHARWLARLAMLGLVLIGYGYFELCRAVGMFVAWSFLLGFPLAFPFTILAVRAERRHNPVWITAVWTVLAFAAFFWSSQAFLWWKAARS